MMKVLAILLLASCLTQVFGDGLSQVNCTGECQKQDPTAHMPIVMKLKLAEHEICSAHHTCPLFVPSVGKQRCEDGKSLVYDCSNVDLLNFVSLYDLGCGGDANDIWGWTDPDDTTREYAIIGCADGTSFVDISDPTATKVLGFLKTHTTSSLWRDMKVYNNYVFIGSEASDHGLQVFDLKRLRDLTATTPPFLLDEDAFYGEFGSSHNIVINEDTGFLYSVGSRTCTSGLHVVNIKDPLKPEFAGCFPNDGYVHDAQCVKYKGPDSRYQEKEICFCYNENTLTIVDVEDKSDMKMLSRVPYQNAYYTHQGWLNEKQTHLLLDDELDELYGPNSHTRTLIWNVENLEQPSLVTSFYSTEQASDHNLYIRGNLAYQANYCAGLRILDVSKMEEGQIEEVGYFDVNPDCNIPGFSGAWSNYPYFASNTIIVSSIERGLFVLKYTGPTK